MLGINRSNIDLTIQEISNSQFRIQHTGSSDLFLVKNAPYITFSKSSQRLIILLIGLLAPSIEYKTCSVRVAYCLIG